MMDWTQNAPNARYWVLKLIKDSFHSGDQLVDTTIDSGDVAAQAFVTPAGHRLLLANKRNRTVEIALPDADKAQAVTVDLETVDGPARGVTPVASHVALGPFAVMVVSW
jgi:hypothetical protein